MENRFDFIPGALNVNGKTFPASYENKPGRVVIVAETADDGAITIEIPETDPRFMLAYAVADETARKAAQEPEKRPETILNNETEKEEEKKMITWPELKENDIRRREINKTMSADIKTLEAYYRKNVDMYTCRPDDTILDFIRAVGFDRASAAVATLVNQSAWDGRISKRNAAWAAEIPGALDNEAANHLYMYTNEIHKAHLNQLADVLRTLDPDKIPAPAPETSAPAESPEERPETISEPAETAAPAPDAAETETAPETIRPIEDLRKLDPEKAAKYEKLIRGAMKANAEKAAQDPAQAPAPEASATAPERKRPETILKASPEKPPRGPAKEKDFAGESLTGKGWSIVFDTGLNRTRVIVAEPFREKLRPMIEAAGFYYSNAQNSWNKKLTHKAHRAAVALADNLRAALA